MTLNLSIKSIIIRKGQEVTWQHTGQGGVDLDSGDQQEASMPQVIRKALVLPEIITEKFTYDLSYIAANKNFVQGGFYDQGKRAILILKSDLPSYSQQDRVVIDGTEYRIHQSIDNPNGVWMFNLTDIKNVS